MVKKKKRKAFRGALRKRKTKKDARSAFFSPAGLRKQKARLKALFDRAFADIDAEILRLK